MRCTERAIEILAAKFRIPGDVRATAGAQTIIGKIRTIISDKQTALKKTKKTSRRNAELSWWGEANVRLEDVKDAWRNEVSHARRPYTEAEAADIYRITCRLMQHLATRLREPKGRP
jgi:hypothetical protein